MKIILKLYLREEILMLLVVLTFIFTSWTMTTHKSCNFQPGDSDLTDSDGNAAAAALKWARDGSGLTKAHNGTDVMN